MSSTTAMALFRQAFPGLQRLAQARATSASALQALRGYAAEPAEDDDVVLSSFREQQKQLRGFMDGIKTIKVPLDGDPAKVKKFAEDVEGLKKKLGVPPPEGIWNATLNYKHRVAGGDPQKFLTSALEGIDPGEFTGYVADLEAAIAETEAANGPLTADNKKGWAALSTKVDALMKAAGLDDYEKLKSSATFDMYNDILNEVRVKAIEDMDNIKRRDGLEFIEVDVAKLTPKW